MVAVPSYHFSIHLTEGSVWWWFFFFLKSFHFTEMRLIMDRQMFKPGKTKILKGYCLQCSAENDRRTWERKETGNRNYFNYACIRQNNSCKQGTNFLISPMQFYLIFLTMQGSCCVIHSHLHFPKKKDANVSVFTIYQDIKIIMLLTVVHPPKWLKNYNTIIEQQFPVKIHTSAARTCLSPSHKLYLYMPVAFATVREEVLGERTKIHVKISSLPFGPGQLKNSCQNLCSFKSSVVIRWSCNIYVAARLLVK